MSNSSHGTFFKKMPRRHLCTAVAGAVMAIAASAPVGAQVNDDVVKIGVLADMSGIYSDMGGSGIVEAVKFAIADRSLAVSGVTPQSLGLGMLRHLSTSARTPLMMAEWYFCSSSETASAMSSSACSDLPLRFLG